MVPNFRVVFGFCFNSSHWDFDFVDSFLPGSKVARDLKNLICVELLFTWFEVDLIDVLFGHFDYVLDLGF